MLYASLRGDPSYLDIAVQHLLESLAERPKPEVLWRMQYRHHAEAEQPRNTTTSENVVTLQPLSTDIVLEDDVLTSAEQAWRKIMGDGAAEFMKFESREGVDEDE